MGYHQSTVQITVFLLGLSVLNIYAKECTNTTPMQSHTLRYEILSSKNETWKKEMLAQYHHHDHVTPTDDSAWANLFPRKMLMDGDELSWNVVYRKMKHPGHFKLDGDFLKEVSLHDVRLEPESLHWRAQRTNLEYLMWLDLDSLLWSFRKTAGLVAHGSPYGGWEGPDVELRGHFVGHYLSATAQMWASTHNESLKQKMSSFEAIQPVWAPYYTIHKIMAGLLDQYTFSGNSQSLKMLNWMVDYFFNRVQNVIAKYSIERHWMSLNEEVGGMNDLLYRLYSVTGNQKHLLLAHLFDKPCFLGILAMKADDISGFHANTHIPIVIGAQMRYEVTGDELYREIGTFFMDIVNTTHAYATGGTSVSEFWADPKRLGNNLQTENEESCTTYNMLKVVSRNLFRWTREITYADYYERALTNGVLSIQRRPEPGIMIYMLPLGHGVSKAVSYHGWGTKNDSFWCCYGTGIESFSKLGDSIYFEEGGKAPGLYIIQYIASSFNWSSGNISLTQNVKNIVSWDQRLQVTLTVSAGEGSMTSTLNVRVPSWTYSNRAVSTLNGEKLVLPNPGSFLSVTRNWKSGDQIVLELPLTLRTEAVQDDRDSYGSLHAILYGPYLLAGLTDRDYSLKIGETNSMSDWISPIPSTYNSNLISLSQDGQLFIAATNRSITMESSPSDGTDSAVRATFRLITSTSSSHSLSVGPKGLIGEVVRLEPFGYPGMVVAHNGPEQGLVVRNDDDGNAAKFRVLKGLNGKEGSVSFESESKSGCYVYSGTRSSLSVTLSCKPSSSRRKRSSGFEERTSFEWSEGIRAYNPVSFVAKGNGRSYLLEPLLSLRDESYNVYFNFV
ncbi:hypothetical protein V2J09_006172 [Rumex salicifolius]